MISISIFKRFRFGLSIIQINKKMITRCFSTAVPKLCRAMKLQGKASKDAVLSLTHLHQTREPNFNEVTVKVDACAVAYRDVLDRTGAFPFIKPNAVLGHEFAGTVVSVGSKANKFCVGQKVVSLHWDQEESFPSPLTRNGPVKSFLGLTTDGGYSEYCTVAEGALVPTPKEGGWSAIDAAPVMSTFGTVWQGAVVRAKLSRKDRVLVTGASGGVGSASIQLCKAIGCRSIIALTSSSKNIEYLKSIGADHVIVSERNNKDKEISFHHDSSVSEEGGVDVVLECVGGPTFSSSLKSLRPEGRLVLVGNVSNARVPLPLGLVILNSLKIVGSDSIESNELRNLFEFLTKAGIRPQIDQILPLENAMDAHQMLENGSTTGRIVLQISNNNWENLSE
jgi:acryloyl-coenzyme A reductase